MLLIDGIIRKMLSRYDLDGVGLVRAGDDSHVYRAGPAAGRKMDGVVMFTGLDPGRYTLRIARASNVNGWIVTELPSHPDLVVEIRPGQVHYLGRLVLKPKRKSAEVAVERDAVRESEVLSGFAKTYAGTPWAARAAPPHTAERAPGR